MEIKKKRSFGGRTSTSWDAKWLLGKTKPIRIPESIAEEILEIARAIDSGKIDPTLILTLIDKT